VTLKLATFPNSKEYFGFPDTSQGTTLRIVRLPDPLTVYATGFIAKKLTMIAKRTNVSAVTTNLTFNADFSFPLTLVSPLRGYFRFC